MDLSLCTTQHACVCTWAHIHEYTHTQCGVCAAVKERTGPAATTHLQHLPDHVECRVRVWLSWALRCPGPGLDSPPFAVLPGAGLPWDEVGLLFVSSVCESARWSYHRSASFPD